MQVVIANCDLALGRGDVDAAVAILSQVLSPCMPLSDPNLHLLILNQHTYSYTYSANLYFLEVASSTAISIPASCSRKVHFQQKFSCRKPTITSLETLCAQYNQDFDSRPYVWQRN